MTLPAALVPRTGDRGCATSDPAGVAGRVLAAWDALLAQAAGLDPDAPARPEGRSVRQVLVPLGAWPQARTLLVLLADARAGRTTAEPREQAERRLLEAHADASRAELLASLRQARDMAAEWFAGGCPDGLAVTGSLLGPLPVATLVHASCFQLACAALDLAPAGPPPAPALLAAGLVGLVDTTGALAARAGSTASIAALTPQVRVGTAAVPGAWRTAVLGAGDGADDPGPAVEGAVDVILDVAAGRRSAVAAAGRGRLRTHDLPGLLPLVGVLQASEGVPARGALVRAAGTLAAAASAASALRARVPFRR